MSLGLQIRDEALARLTQRQTGDHNAHRAGEGSSHHRPSNAGADDLEAAPAQGINDNDVGQDDDLMHGADHDARSPRPSSRSSSSSSSSNEEGRDYDVPPSSPPLTPSGLRQRSVSPTDSSRSGGRDHDGMSLVEEEQAGLRGPEDEFLFQDPHRVRFGGQAGALVDEPPDIERPKEEPFALYEAGLADTISDENVFAPFASEREWHIAQWAKKRGPSASAFNEFLAIDGVRDALDLSFKNTKDLNKIIDSSLPSRPAFVRQVLEVDGETYDLWLRDVMQCIRVLFGSPDWVADLLVSPERHYTDEDKSTRIYGDMNTGEWWWRLQHKIEAKEPGGTIVPLILSSDKTQLTMFRNRSCYPLYLTIGNIPKAIRRKSSRQAQLLIGYLPVTRLSHIKNEETRRRAISNLFHACLKQALAPTRKPARRGVKMSSGDGSTRRCHPIFAAYIGDYPEIVCVAGVKNGECPAGVVDPKSMGEAVPCTQRDLNAILHALSTFERTGDPVAHVHACQDAGIKPIADPFWKDLPYVNIYASFPPDILHQLYQGMVKHVIGWTKTAYGARVIDARFQALPPNHNLRHFSKGISHLSRVSGTEHQDICRVLLGTIIDLHLPGGQSPVRLVRAVRALLDFVYLAQLPAHTSTTLSQLDDSLARFHANKGVFVDLGIRDHFNFPKLHSLQHYVSGIKMFGTADGTNTAQSEHLHISLAKDPWRKSNRKDEYPQMTSSVVRLEQIHAHALYIDWRLAGRPDLPTTPPVIPHKLHQHLTRYPTHKSLSFSTVETRYGAPRFQTVLKEFIAHFKHPHLSGRDFANFVSVYDLPFRSVSVWHKVKFWNQDPFQRREAPETLDVIHARSAYRDTQGRVVAGRFDTALVNEKGDGGFVGVSGYRVGQVRVIFSLSKKAHEIVFKNEPDAPSHFVYLEWFSRFKSRPEANHLFYTVTRSRDADQQRVAAIVPLKNLHRMVNYALSGRRIRQRVTAQLRTVAWHSRPMLPLLALASASAFQRKRGNTAPCLRLVPTPATTASSGSSSSVTTTTVRVRPLELHFLGDFAVVPWSVARIHETNLNKQGMLALTFADSEDSEKVRSQDRVDIGVFESFAPAKNLTLVLKPRDGSKEEVSLTYSFNRGILEPDGDEPTNGGGRMGEGQPRALRHAAPDCCTLQMATASTQAQPRLASGPPHVTAGQGKQWTVGKRRMAGEGEPAVKDEAGPRHRVSHREDEDAGRSPCVQGPAPAIEKLPPLADYDSAKHLVKHSFKRLDLFQVAKQRHILLGLMAVFLTEYIVLAITLTIQVVTFFASPLGIRNLLHYLETRRTATARSRVRGCGCWLFVGPMVGSIALQVYIFTMTRMLVRTMSIITQLLFEHSLRIRMKAEVADSPLVLTKVRQLAKKRETSMPDDKEDVVYEPSRPRSRRRSGYGRVGLRTQELADETSAGGLYGQLYHHYGHYLRGMTAEYSAA
ncbi:uncharacterized protein B0H18DRAFT_1115738 [Fomitopsis serialis]|uniref:uncharacterized protein n=1 Tax=Fomitopsis serialis TaxID=139415 RepID=UPI002008758B|nr:uncharacterized protein B0H18DRAFT_1115738 [Neoantrodia serialis]KAH9932480.1 hypothetical protein B0H18DRAFT_1115738 [Neoantrodia serialis]